MPQMAPVLWLPLFFSVVFILFTVKSTLYFSGLTALKLKGTPKLSGPHNSWLW